MAESHIHKASLQVYIGNCYERWNKLRSSLQLSNPEFAELLINIFEKHTTENQSEDTTEGRPEATTSVVTPVPKFTAASKTYKRSPFKFSAATMSKVPKAKKRTAFDEVVEFTSNSAAQKATDNDLELDPATISTPKKRILEDTEDPDKDICAREIRHSTPLGLKSRQMCKLTLSPVAEDCENETNNDDEVLLDDVCDDWGSSLDDYSLVIEDDVLEYSLSSEDLPNENECWETSFTEREPAKKTANISEELNTPQQIIAAKKCIVFTALLTELVQKAFGKKCHCGKIMDYKMSNVGSAVLYKFQCHSGHDNHVKGSWASQPRLYGLYAGNILIPSAIVLSGNQYQKVGLMAHHANLQFISKNTFYRAQKFFISPAVKSYWEQMVHTNIVALSGKKVVVAADGRCDSPGFSAMYCTYSMADTETRMILSLVNVDVRQTDGKSTNMEFYAFQKSLESLKTDLASVDASITEIVTDAHISIAKFMKTKEKEVKHSWDVWHGAKNLSKKLTSAASLAANVNIAFWIPDIRLHFWYCSQTCGGNALNFRLRWQTLVRHVANVHQWGYNFGAGYACHHKPLCEEERDKPWLDARSPAFNELVKIVLDPQFLNNLPYYANFRHTGWLEAYHNQLLMYASKRQSYSWTGYVTRMQLAAIDYNSHIGRTQDTTKDGKFRYRSNFNKRTKDWCAVPIRQKKTYSYIPELLASIFEERRKFSVSRKNYDMHVSLDEDDPRRIHPSRSLIDRPTVQELVTRHESRFHITDYSIIDTCPVCDEELPAPMLIEHLKTHVL